MRRLLFSIGLILLMMATSHTPQAAVTGKCSECHTMHYSQGGGALSEWGLTGPYAALLVNDCVGCHTNSDNGDTIVTGVPIVFNTVEPNNPLAGGNFYEVVADDAKGHNVVGIKGADGTLVLTPPGGSTMAQQLSCAGMYGCHGDRSETVELDAIRTAHHADDSMLKFGGNFTLTGQGTSPGKSYRFLNKVRGAEDADWQDNATQTSHNEYMGKATAPTGVLVDDPGTDGTISGLCAECHGDFHDSGTWDTGEVGASEASPWIRHPTNYQLPPDGDKEYQNYNPDGGNLYSIEAPLARPATFFTDALDSASNEGVTPGDPGTTTNAIVMCLSCHRAHASLYYKIMRWDYKNQSSLSTALSGCSVCHTSKKGTADEPYTVSAHGNTSYGVNRTSTSQYMQGNCAHCHEQHASIGGVEPNPTGGPDKYLLFAPNATDQDENFCFECHTGGGQQDPPISNNNSYSYNFGGNHSADSYDDDIMEAFSHSISAAGPGSSHHLPDFVSQVIDKDMQDAAGNTWRLPAGINPCDACHNPHLAQRNWPIPIADGKLKTAISRPSRPDDLWGDDSNERMSSVGDYYTPRWYAGVGKYEPDGGAIRDGANMPDYVRLCTDCHNDYNTIYSTNPRLPRGPRNLIGFNWGVDNGPKQPLLHGARHGTDPAWHLRRVYALLGDVNITLSCLDCHEPHGSHNHIYLMRTSINGTDLLQFDGENDISWKLLCNRCHVGYIGTDSKHSPGIDDCIECHTHLNSTLF